MGCELLEMYSYSCDLLESNYGCSCAGCSCTFSYTEGDCDADGGHYCGDDGDNWTSFSPYGCVPSYYICDVWEDCVDASDENCDESSSTEECDNADYDGSGEVDVLDVVATVNVILYSEPETVNGCMAGDADESGDVDVLDVVSMVNTIL